MNYFNFFSQSDRSSFGKKKAEMRDVIILCIVVVIALLGLEITTGLIERSYNNQLEFVKGIYANPQFIEQCSVANQVKKEISETSEGNSFLSRLHTASKDISVTNRVLFDRINEHFVDSSLIDSIMVSGQYVAITGNIKDIDRITQISTAFRNDPDFRDVIVTIISDDNSNNSSRYSFSISMFVNGKAIEETQEVAVDGQ